jgi:rubrerythrin
MTTPERALVAELKTSFAAESMAAQRYGYYARIAEIEGLSDAAMLFRRLAESVACVAQGHLDVLRDSGEDVECRIGDTRTNLASEVNRELQTADSHYPELKAAALAEGMADITSWLTTVIALKHAHLTKLDAALTETVAAHSTAKDISDGR